MALVAGALYALATNALAPVSFDTNQIYFCTLATVGGATVMMPALGTQSGPVVLPSDDSTHWVQVDPLESVPAAVGIPEAFAAGDDVRIVDQGTPLYAIDLIYAYPAKGPYTNGWAALIPLSAGIQSGDFLVQLSLLHKVGTL